MKATIADGVVDIDRRTVQRAGETTRLTTREAALLRYLVERSREDVSKDALLSDVWGYRSTNPTRAVDHTVLRLRAKVEADPSSPVHLLTIRGVGFRWVPPDGAPASVPTVRVPDRLTARVIGRQRERALLSAQLVDPGLVTLVGPGGIGKSALARATGPLLEVELSQAGSLDDVVRQTAAALAVPVVGGSEVQGVARALAALGPVTVLFDGFERAVASAGPTLGVFRAAAPSLRLLVTSQERLHLDAERLIEVGPLTAGDAVALLRARAEALPQADASWQDARALAQLAERLDRLPLALELAAGRAGVLAVSQVLALLDERFRLLVDPGQGRPERHQTLRASVAWSWDLLDRWGRAALERFSVFVGSFDLHAASAVLPEGAPWALDLVQDLVDKSLLQVGATVLGRRRYRLLDAVRDFAFAQLGEREADARRAHAAYFRDAALAASDGWEPLAAEQHWFQTEVANLTAAFEALESDADAARLGVSLGASLVRDGPVAVRRRVLDRTVERARASGDPELHAVALGSRARDLREQPERARADLDHALRRVAPDTPARGLVLLWSSIMRSWIADRAGSLADIDAATAVFEAVGPRARLASAHVTRAAFLSQLGETAASLRAVEQGLELLGEYDDERVLAFALATKARVVPSVREAVQLLEDAEGLLDAVGDRTSQMAVITTRVSFELFRGRLDLLDVLRPCRAEAQRLGQQVTEGWAVRGLCEVSLELGAIDEARRLLHQARALFGEGAALGAVDLDRLEAMILLDEGSVAGVPELADRWRDQVAHAQTTGPAVHAELHAAAWALRGDAAKAVEHLEAGLVQLDAVPEVRLAAHHDLRAMARARLLGTVAVCRMWSGRPDAAEALQRATAAAPGFDLRWARVKPLLRALVDGAEPPVLERPGWLERQIVRWAAACA